MSCLPERNRQGREPYGYPRKGSPGEGMARAKVLRPKHGWHIGEAGGAQCAWSRVTEGESSKR